MGWWGWMRRSLIRRPFPRGGKGVSIPLPPGEGQG
jgi:hypothetical protein